MVKKEKCSACRLAKQKCLPDYRIWDESVQEKCTNCIKGNRQCGPNENPPHQPPRGRSIRARHGRNGSCVSQSAENSPAQENNEDMPGLTKESCKYVSDNTKELRDRLKDLDAAAALARNVDIATKDLNMHALQNNIPNTGSDAHARDRTAAQSAISQDLLSKLNVVEILGDRADAAGEKDLAELAYTRLLDIYRRHPYPVGSLIRSLLIKMAVFYWESDQPLRAEMCWWDVFDLRDPPDQAHGIEREVWESLAKSLSETSGVICEVLRAKLTGFFPSLNLETPFPPVHRMIRGNHGLSTTDSLFRINPSSNITSSSNTLNASPGNVGNIEKTIQELPDMALDTRDIFFRTPLFLAAFLKHEVAGHALVKRIATCSSKPPHIHINARDFSGQTVLGIAILSRCSFKFVKALIDNGAEVNPGLTEGPYTPLQAACITGDLEITNILLDSGADINHVYEDNPTPAALAQDYGHFNILQLIAEKTQSSLQSSPPFSNQSHSEVGNNIIASVSSNIPSITGAIINNTQLTGNRIPSPSELFSSDWNEYLDVPDGNDDMIS